MAVATPQPSAAHLGLGPEFFDEVSAAQFPSLRVRFRHEEAASSIGLGGMPTGPWVDKMGRFEPFEGSLPRPLALRYHGHQFGHYNPNLGDGRGFLYAQFIDHAGRLMDLGTKGSGTTPWSRGGDGRLTLQGAVREVLAGERLWALGVPTSRALSVIETGEELYRGDEPSPTRSAVLVRLSHSHIRIGTFQRLTYLGRHQDLERLVSYCLQHYLPEALSQDACGMLDAVSTRLAELTAAWMVAGFVHGVLNTDNLNVTGESFDYGPWRFLPEIDGSFVAAYFDHGGRYAYARQPEAVFWALQQLAWSLRPLADDDALTKGLSRFGETYERAYTSRLLARMGLVAKGDERDLHAADLALELLQGRRLHPDQFFEWSRATMGGWAGPSSGLDAKDEARLWHELKGFEPAQLAEPEGELLHLQDPMYRPIWQAIADSDDWRPFERWVEAQRCLARHLAPVHRSHSARGAANAREAWPQRADPRASAREETT